VVNMQHLEAVAREFINLFSISAPPIPVEKMLQSPLPGMWDEVDVSQMTARLDLSSPYSPQMSMARLLARNIIASNWGIAHELGGLDEDETIVRAFARMLVMPADMIMQLNEASRTPQLLSLHFEVPEAEAKQRLQELNGK
jgi:hypothetical protein